MCNTSCSMDVKGIYCLKIYMFHDHFRLTVAENKGMTATSLFVLLIYGHYWNTAPLAERAPLNDTKLLAQIKGCCSDKAIRHHLWYFSEHLVGLSLFDPQSRSLSSRQW